MQMLMLAFLVTALSATVTVYVLTSFLQAAVDGLAGTDAVGGALFTGVLAFVSCLFTMSPTTVVTWLDLVVRFLLTSLFICLLFGIGFGAWGLGKLAHRLGLWTRR